MGSLLFALAPIILPIALIILIIILHERKKIKLLKEQNKLLENLKESKQKLSFLISTKKNMNQPNKKTRNNNKNNHICKTNKNIKNMPSIISKQRPYPSEPIAYIHTNTPYRLKKRNIPIPADIPRAVVITDDIPGGNQPNTLPHTPRKLLFSNN